MFEPKVFARDIGKLFAEAGAPAWKSHLALGAAGGAIGLAAGPQLFGVRSRSEGLKRGALYGAGLGLGLQYRRGLMASGRWLWERGSYGTARAFESVQELWRRGGAQAAEEAAEAAE